MAYNKISPGTKINTDKSVLHGQYEQDIIQLSKNQQDSNIGDINKQSMGTQVLREYLFYNKFNFQKFVQKYDPAEVGYIKPNQFKEALMTSQLIFSHSIVEEIIKDSPKNWNQEILYNELYQNLINFDSPQTYYSLSLESQHNLDPIDSYRWLSHRQAKSNHLLKFSGIDSSQNPEAKSHKILQNNFFDCKESFTIKNFGLHDLQVDYLRSDPSSEDHGANANRHRQQSRFGVKDSELIIKHNNLTLLKNFMKKVAKYIWDYTRGDTQQVREEVVEKYILENCNISKPDIYKTIFPKDFTNIINTSYKMNLSADEIAQLQYLIINENVSVSGGFTYRVFIDFVLKFHIMNEEQRITLANKISQENINYAHRMKKPTLLNQIVKYCGIFGNKCLLDSLRNFPSYRSFYFDDFFRILQGYDIYGSQNDQQEMRDFIIENGYTIADDKRQPGQNIESISLSINRPTLLDFLEKYIKTHAPKDQNNENLPTDPEGKASFRKSMIGAPSINEDLLLTRVKSILFDYILDDLMNRISPYADGRKMIQESKIRESWFSIYPKFELKMFDELLSIMSNFFLIKKQKKLGDQYRKITIKLVIVLMKLSKDCVKLSLQMELVQKLANKG